MLMRTDQPVFYRSISFVKKLATVYLLLLVDCILFMPYYSFNRKKRGSFTAELSQGSFLSFAMDVTYTILRAV